MSTITLDTIDLPGALWWEDEYSPPIVESITHLLSGVRYIEESIPPSGRPITLKYQGNNTVTRGTVNALYALMTSDRTMTLTLADNREFAVRWRYRNGGLKAVPALFYEAPDNDDPYFLELYLETA